MAQDLTQEEKDFQKKFLDEFFKQSKETIEKISAFQLEFDKKKTEEQARIEAQIMEEQRKKSGASLIDSFSKEFKDQMNKIPKIMVQDFDKTWKEVRPRDVDASKFKNTHVATDTGDLRLKNKFDKIGDVIDAVSKKLNGLSLAATASSAAVKIFGPGKTAMAGKAKSAVMNTAHSLTTAAGNTLSKGIGAIASPIKGIASAVNPVVGALADPISSLQGIFGPIASMVEKINPQLVQQYTLAMDDLMAVMGDALQPILKAGVTLVRLFADTMETLRPAIDPLIGSVVELMKVFAQLIEPIAQLMIPYMQIYAALISDVVVPAIQGLVDAFKWLVEMLRKSANLIIDVINELATAINKLLPKKLQLGKLGRIAKFGEGEFTKKDSFGKAIRNTSTMSAAQLGESTRQAAFGQTVDWNKQTAMEAKKIAEKTDEVIKNTKEIEDKMSGVKNIGDALIKLLGTGL